MRSVTVPAQVAAINREIVKFFKETDTEGRLIGNARYGVYAFYDYDGEPIYVGQTAEMLRVRIRRHLTNQRTDAVAMNVLDPFEVAEIEVWPFFDLVPPGAAETLNAAEYTVFQKVLASSALKAVLNEKVIPVKPIIDLPASFRYKIVPPEIFDDLRHSDIRIARRASTIANLARVISERDVSPGLRRTLLTQARRLENLAALRLTEIGGLLPVEGAGEETGDE
jgi:hypothetical protein